MLLKVCHPSSLIPITYQSKLRKKKTKRILTPNIARKSGSRNRNGIFDTCSRFGWFFESDDGITANVDTDVVIDGSVTNAVDAAADDADDEAVNAADETAAIMLASSAACCCCWTDSDSFCCNSSGCNDTNGNVEVIWMVKSRVLH